MPRSGSRSRTTGCPATPRAATNRVDAARVDTPRLTAARRCTPGPVVSLHRDLAGTPLCQQLLLGALLIALLAAPIATASTSPAEADGQQPHRPELSCAETQDDVLSGPTWSASVTQ